MVKLTKAIIKKYGISKKAWAVARGKKRSVKTSKKKAKVQTMAKKRKSYTKKKSSSSKTGGFLENVMKKAATPVIGMAWGFAREPVNDFLASKTILGKLPSKYGDEITGLGLAHAASYAGFGKHWLGRKTISIVKHQEWGNVGRQLYVDYKAKKGGSTSSTNTGIFV